MRTEEEEEENFAVNFVKMLKLKTEEEKAFAKTFLSDLTPLISYSKPKIDHLTKMARDKIGYAHVVVKVTEQHLMSIEAERRLPVLYLIDSIVQNVKGVYVVLFQLHIVVGFCTVFEMVGAQTRVKLLNLRHDWNEVFESNKLKKIDERIRQIEVGWTITKKSSSCVQDTSTLPDSAQAAGTSNEPSSSAATPETARPAVVKADTGGLSFSFLENATEAQLRELLIKQTELIDLQKKTIESESSQAKSKFEEQDRTIKELHECVQRTEQERKNSEMMSRPKSIEGYVAICNHCGVHSSDLQVCVKCDEKILPNANLILDPRRKSNEIVSPTIERRDSEKSTEKTVNAEDFQRKPIEGAGGAENAVVVPASSSSGSSLASLESAGHLSQHNADFFEKSEIHYLSILVLFLIRAQVASFKTIESELSQAKSKLEEQDRTIKELEERAEQERKNSDMMTRPKSIKDYIAICDHCGFHSSDLHVCVKCDEKNSPEYKSYLAPTQKVKRD